MMIRKKIPKAFRDFFIQCVIKPLDTEMGIVKGNTKEIKEKTTDKNRKGLQPKESLKVQSIKKFCAIIGALI